MGKYKAIGFKLVWIILKDVKNIFQFFSEEADKIEGKILTEKFVW